MGSTMTGVRAVISVALATDVCWNDANPVNTDAANMSPPGTERRATSQVSGVRARYAAIIMTGAASQSRYRTIVPDGAEMPRTSSGPTPQQNTATHTAVYRSSASGAATPVAPNRGGNAAASG